MRPAGAFPGCRTEDVLPLLERLSGGICAGKACAGFGMIRLAGPFSPAGSARRELLRGLPRPPAAVFPPDGPCLHPNGGGAVHALAEVLRRRRAPGKGRWRGLARVSARMPPYPLPARVREMHVRVQRRAKKHGAGDDLHLWPRGRAASRVGSPALERRFTGSADLRASRAGGWEPARGPEKRAGGPSEPPDRAGAFLCSKERTGIPPRIRIPAALDRLPGPRALARGQRAGPRR